VPLQIAASIEGSGPLSAFVGGAAERELVVVATNSGTAVVTGVTIQLFAGKDAVPGELLSAQGGQPLSVGILGPGQSVTVRQPFTIDAPAFGDYRVRGVVAGTPIDVIEGASTSPDDFVVSTSAYPWVWIVLGWLVLLFFLARAVRSRAAAEADIDPLVSVLPALDADREADLSARVAGSTTTSLVPPTLVTATNLDDGTSPEPAPDAAEQRIASESPWAPESQPTLPPTRATAPIAPATSPAPPPPSGYALLDPSVSPQAAPVASGESVDTDVVDAELVDPAPQPEQQAASGLFGVSDLRQIMDRRGD